MVLPHALHNQGSTRFHDPRLAPVVEAQQSDKTPGRDAYRSVGARAETTAHTQTSQNKRPLEKTFSLSDGRASNRASTTSKPRDKSCDLRECQKPQARERCDRQPKVRPHQHVRQQSKRSGKRTNARRVENAHRGITTQRVTILFDRRSATQRASPNRAAEGAVYSGGTRPLAPNTNREDAMRRDFEKTNPKPHDRAGRVVCAPSAW